MTNPRLLFVKLARPWVGTRETSRNQFDGISKLWAATNYPDGWKNREPYCAAFLCWLVKVADELSRDFEFPNRPKYAATRDWIPWARDPKNGVQIIKTKPEPGDIVQFRPHFSHIGLVTGFDAAKKIVSTIEANTNGAGSNEGDGIYAKRRALSICGEFYRLPARALKA